MNPGANKERVCGTCSACCRWPAIPEIDKAARAPCVHLVDGKFGCDRYDDQPKICETYRCSWIRGNGDEEDRPNVCHVLIDMKLTEWGPALVAKSLRPGAVRSRSGLLAIRRVAASRGALCFIVADDDSVRVIGMAGPRELMDTFRKKHGSPTELLAPVKPDLDMNKIMADAMAQHKQFVADQVGRV